MMGSLSYRIRNRSFQGRREGPGKPGFDPLPLFPLCPVTSPRGSAAYDPDPICMKERAHRGCAACFREQSKNAIDSAETMSGKQDQRKGTGRESRD